MTDEPEKKIAVNARRAFLGGVAGVALLASGGASARNVGPLQAQNNLYDLDKIQQALVNISVGAIFDTVSALLADTDMVYTAGGNPTVAAGDTVTAEGYRYTVAASGASDQHVTTAGGVKLYVEPIAGIMPLIPFGANPDGATTTTTAVQACLTAATAAGASVVLIPAGTFKCGTLSVPSNITLTGSGEILQAAVNADLLDLNGVSNVVIDGIRLRGAGSIGDPSASANNAVNIRGNSNNIIVRNCTISYFLEFGLWAEQSTNIKFIGNYLQYTGAGIRLRGVSNFEISSNTLDSTIYLESEFTTAIGLDSTDGHAFGICSNGNITKNDVSGFVNAQAILVHAGNDVVIGSNTLNGMTIGVGVTAYNTTDDINRLIIVENVITCPSSISHTDDGGAGITLMGGPASGGGDTPDPRDCVIANNTINSGNRATENAGLGAIVISFTRRTLCLGNVIQGSGANGIVLVADEVQCLVSGNVIDSTIAFAGEQNGIYVKAGASGEISGNWISNCAYGIYIASITDPLIVRDNSFNANTTANVGGAGVGSAWPGNVLEVTAAGTLDLGGIDVVEFNNASGFTISAFENVIPSQLILFRNIGSGSITIDRSNAYLPGAANVVLATNECIMMCGRTSTTMVAAGLKANNG